MPTTTIFASTTDGYVRSEDATYATAAAGSGAFTVTNNTELQVGQSTNSGNRLQTVYLAFDTSGIPDGDIISAVDLHLFGKQNSSNTDFDLVAKAFDWSAGGLTSADWQTPTQLAALTTLATLNTSGISASAYNALTSAGAPFNAHINKSGTTYLLVTSSRLISATAPSGDEFVVFHSADVAGTTNDPKLVITHSAASPTLSVDPASYAVTGTAAALADSAKLVMVAEAGSYSFDFLGGILAPVSIGGSGRNQFTYFRRPGDPLYEQFIIWSSFDLIHDTDPDQFERLEYLGTPTFEIYPSTSLPAHVFRVHFRDMKTAVVTLAASPFSTTNGTPVVRVTHTAHGQRTGAYVVFSGASSVGGISITTRTYPITYVSDNTYDITHTSNATSTTTGGGTPTATYNQFRIALDAQAITELNVTPSTGPFSTTNGTPVVRVTHTAHGHLTGDSVTVHNPSAVGGITISGTYPITVIDANTYDITHSSAPTLTEIGPTNGTVTVTYSPTRLSSALEAAISYAGAKATALIAAPRLGKMPKLYRQNINYLIIHPGEGIFSSESDGHFFKLYSDRMAVRIAYFNDLEESIFHEAAHAALQSTSSGMGIDYDDSAGWTAAVAADNAFIDDYAESSDQEDFAQSSLMSWAMMTHPERLPEPDRTLIAAQIPNRIAFFRDTVFAGHFTACVRVPAANVAGKLPTGWTASLVDNTALASHCRDLANLKVEAYYSKASLVAAGIPDLYKFFCNVCGRVHVRPCIGNEPRPFWEVR